MRTMCRFLIVLLEIGFLTGCVHNNPNGPFDIAFHHDSDVIVPAKGGIYFFTVEAVKTKMYDWEDVLGFVEYKVHIDNTIVDERSCCVAKQCEYINEGDTIREGFSIPENTSSSPREIFVKAHVLPVEEYGKSNVIDDDALWDIVWQGTQLAP